MAPQNKRLAQPRSEGGFALRVSHQKGRGKRMPRYRVKCGCCEQQLEIYYSAEDLEINGVIASVENWREVLLPLLFPDQLPPNTNAPAISPRGS